MAQGLRIGVVTAKAQVATVVWVPSLAWELPHAAGASPSQTPKKTKTKSPPKRSNLETDVMTLVCEGHAQFKHLQEPGV